MIVRPIVNFINMSMCNFYRSEQTPKAQKDFQIHQHFTRTFSADIFAPKNYKAKM